MIDEEYFDFLVISTPADSHAEIVKAGRSTVGKYHEKFRGGEPTGKSPVAKRIKDEGFRPSTTKAHRWVKVK